VLDIANVIAGPTIGAVLARFGARVTKVDPVRPTYAPDVTVVYGLAANVGKRSVLLDVTDEAPGGGRFAFDALLARSDVLVANATTASLARLGCTPERLARVQPELVLCRFDAWGGPADGAGGRSEHLGYDDNIQAALGIMERFGGGLGRVEEHAHVGTVDVIAGVGGALSTCAALYYRAARRRASTTAARTAGLLIARASLAALGQCVQFPFCCGVPSQLAAASQLAPTTLGPLCRGEHSLLRCYEAADGQWLLLHASLNAPFQTAGTTGTTGGIVKTPMCEGLQQLAAAHPALRAAVHDAGAIRDDDALAAALSAAFRADASAEEWVRLLRAQGIAAVALCSLRELRQRHACTALNLHGPSLQFLTATDHPVGSALTQFAPVAIRPALTPLVAPLTHAPQYGEHTREALAEEGIDAAPLIARGVASEGWSKAYLPGGPLPATALPTPAAAPVPEAATQESNECPVCLETIVGPRLLLACAHSLCSSCAAQCSDARHRRCPVCRVPHLLHPSRLAERSTAWRQRYAAWRVGNSAGARGELSSIRMPSALEEISEVGGMRFHVGHSSLGGDLHYAARSTRPQSSATRLSKAKTAPDLASLAEEKMSSHALGGVAH